jgi:hypothetical protein
LEIQFKSCSNKSMIELFVKDLLNLLSIIDMINKIYIKSETIIVH